MWRLKNEKQTKFKALTKLKIYFKDNHSLDYYLTIIQIADFDITISHN